jgi:hypothetical protein
VTPQRRTSLAAVLIVCALVSACASSGATTQRRAAMAEAAYAQTLQQLRVSVDTLRATNVLSAADAKVWYRSLLALNTAGVALNKGIRTSTAAEALTVAVGVVDQVIAEDLPTVPEAKRGELLLLLTSLKSTLLILSVVL